LDFKQIIFSFAKFDLTKPIDFSKIFAILITCFIIILILCLTFILWKSGLMSLFFRAVKNLISKINFSSYKFPKSTINKEINTNKMKDINYKFFNFNKNKIQNKQSEFVYIGVIAIKSLPSWFDVSSSDFEGQRKELYVRQFEATRNFLSSILDGYFSFNQVFAYTDGKLTIQYLFSNNNQEVLVKKVRNFDRLLKIFFKGIHTETSIIQNNPFIELLNNKHLFYVIKGTSIIGDFIYNQELAEPILNQLNLFFRTEKQNGFFIISNEPILQEGILFDFDRFIKNRKVSKLSEQTQHSISKSGFLGSYSTSRINRKKVKELAKAEVDLKRAESKVLNRVGLFLCCIDSGNTIDEAKFKVNNSLSISKSSLSPLMQSSSEFPLSFKDWSIEKSTYFIENIHSISNPFPTNLELLPEELAFICRFPSTDALPITQEQKTITQINQPKLLNNGLALGKLVGSDGSLSSIYYQNPDYLVTQELITGTTGCGKTSTLCSQIINLEGLGIKSLIIDPKGTIFPLLQPFIPDIQVFEFGKNSTSLGKCNILECPDWMDVQTHFNLVENILLSVWQVFPPMNMVIHQALTHLFNTDGWNIKKNEHGKNRTLNDLQREIEQVEKEMGYSRDTHLDISSALKMRLNYFTHGQIGDQINCHRSIPIEDLLEKTTIISLEHANSYAEKVVVLTFLGRIFEYFKQKPITDNLRHFLTVDEAEHYFGLDQLLVYDDYEKAAAGKAATKKLIQMIAQSRAYGLGIAISTQSPSKIPREIMINCNTKIIHKVIDGQDISYLQKSMRLTDGQADMIPSLKVGEAIVMDPINSYPFKVKIILPEGLTEFGKGIHSKQKEKMMGERMRDYFLKNVDLYRTKINEDNEMNHNTQDDDTFFDEEIFDEESYTFLKDENRNESLLTEADYELLHSPFFRRLFYDTLNFTFKKENKISESKRTALFAGFLDFCFKVLKNNEQKESVIEFISKAFDHYFKHNPRAKQKVMEKVSSIVESWNY